MKSFDELIGWLVGVMGGIILIGWRLDKKGDSDKFKALFESQKEMDTKLGIVETKQDKAELYYLKTLEEIKAQQISMAADVTTIKISVAGIPKRTDD